MQLPDVIAIDDDPSIRWLLNELLMLTGVNYAVTGSAAEGIAFAEEHRPALAFVDVRLGGLDGIDVARRIKAASPETEIVFLTGYGERVRAAVTQRELPHELVEKPFDINVLLQKVEAICRSRRAIGGERQAASGL